ncbi:MAG: aminotransferase class V-fold PLP-dependent enzyme [Pseudomonadota bacterium]
MTQLIERIREAVIGERQGVETPFGRKPLVYADYTASGRSLSFIEDYIRDHVLPYYANTHTETSFTGAQTTALREEARNEIRRAVNGGDEDKVIFCGPGATAAINKLMDILNLRLPHDLAERCDLEQHIPLSERPVIFVGPYEHHSNELPWRESIADVVSIPLNEKGQIDLQVLENELVQHADRPLRIGSFSAASNVTGIRSDVVRMTALLKQHGALAFWDYAAAAPYVGIDMNGESPIDAVFISPHKFVGGPGTPGVLVVKSQVLNNSVPAVVGGGTVLYVTPQDHRFLDDAERREEGGTPAIVESIRAGLVFKLQQQVGTDVIEAREKRFVQRALARLADCPELDILGNRHAERISILSLRFRHGDRDLHYGFVVSLLNDLFGIQVRGGCSCAGPYGHALLNMDMDYSRALEKEIRAGAMILRPGWVRLNFNYFISEQEFEYLLGAIELVAKHGWRLLPHYVFDTKAGVWRFEGRSMELPVRLADVDFMPAEASRAVEHLALCGKLACAERELLAERSIPVIRPLGLSSGADRLRWFLLPEDVVDKLHGAQKGAQPDQQTEQQQVPASV